MSIPILNLTFIGLEQRRVQVAEDIALVYDAGPANNGVHWRFDHLCEVISDPDEEQVQKRVASWLSPGHTIESGEPLTISPSILCLSCGLHGWVRDDQWIPA